MLFLFLHLVDELYETVLSKKNYFVVNGSAAFCMQLRTHTLKNVKFTVKEIYAFTFLALKCFKERFI